AGFGLSATPDDLLMHQVRLDAAADLKEFADALRAPGTPMSELRRLADKFATRAARGNNLTLSEWGVIQDQAIITVLVSRRLPGLYDALMSEIARLLALPPTPPIFAAARSGAAAAKGDLRPESTLGELLVTEAMEFIVEKITDELNTKYKAAKQYTTDILKQAAWGAGVVMATQHIRAWLKAEDAPAVISGASMSFRLFNSPFSVIEAKVEKDYPDLNHVLLIGPSVFDFVKPLVEKLQDGFQYRKTLDPNDPKVFRKLDDFKGTLEELKDTLEGAVDEAKNAYQPAKEADRMCIFTSDPACGQLLYPDGFISVYKYSPPQGFPGFTGLPLPIVFVIYNTVTGELAFDTPPFFPTPATP
ncbi:MAG: hypothetical protein IT162_05985, partial [Bryobacterales bacterium]|nr:hypothetical protein [Bryobacterales bacterium]